MAFGFFKSFGTANYSLGIDIGTNSIKLVELEKRGESLWLSAYGVIENLDHLEDLGKSLQTSAKPLDLEKITQLLKQLVRESVIHSTELVGSVPAFHTFTTLLEMPVMSDRETVQAMQFQAKQYVPLPLESVTLDWMRVGTRQDEESRQYQHILFVAVPNEEIQRYRDIFQSAGLKLSILEVEGVSLARILTLEKESPTMIIDIGSRSTTLIIARHGLMQAAGQTDFAGDSFTKTLADGLNLRRRRAEDLKKQKGLIDTGSESDLIRLLAPLADVIINEGARLKEEHEREMRESVTEVILSGGGANLPGLAPYVHQRLGLPVKIADPFSVIHCEEILRDTLKELGPQFSVVLGLSLRSFI